MTGPGISGTLHLAAAMGIFDLLEASPGVLDLPAPRHSLKDPSITFDHVTFTYPGGRGAPALEDVSFHISRGQRLGVVGRSGSGKTTLLWLLQRLYDPQAGRIVLNGVDLCELTFEQIRAQMAVVAQDTYLFSGTVADNLRLGNPGASFEELQTAARAANADEFIERLPDGYATQVGERGVRLSGGQRQRIAIARALLKDAPILVLDEATSSVDARNEALIQQALDRLSVGRLTLVMAHRLSSVASADRILVLEHGHLVESGAHSELLARGGAYAALMADQVPELQPHALITDDHQPDTTLDDVTTEERDDDDADDVRRAPTSAIPEGDQRARLETARFMLRLLADSPRRLASIALLSLAARGSVIGLGVVGALLVGRAVQRQPLEGQLALLGGFCALAIGLAWSESWFSHGMAFGTLAALRIDFFRALDRLGPGYLQRRRTGDLVGIATRDIDGLEFFYAHWLPAVGVAVVVPLGLLLWLATIAPLLGLLLVLFLLAMSAPIALSLDRRRNFILVHEKAAAMNAHAVDTLQGLREIVAFDRGHARLQEGLAATRDYAEELLRFFRRYYRQKIVTDVLVGSGLLVILIATALLIQQGALDRQVLLLVIILVLEALSPAVDFSLFTSMVAGNVAAASRVAAVELERPTVSDGPGVQARACSTRSMSAIQFEDVGFQYDYGRGWAVRHVSFDVPTSATLALVGHSGAGKTTLAHLLLRFWDPTTGRVLLGGIDLRAYRLAELRERLALVSQDTYLFNASIGDNLLIARPEATTAQVQQAIEQAGLAEFVTSLPAGLETPVGERGAHLSGGQRQRIAIARAFLKDAPILVLDEATSHLDALNERLVRQALDRLKADRTTLIIAHRLSTIREADAIVVLDRGQPAEIGTHAELLGRQGAYARLVASQQQAALIS